ncbi:MAG TPA: biotin-independent malonate decarboxylase subunit gamma [Pusillimonas sp.]|uniref:biotin-independent malonate decarboxylase subunit gamma n=1 Tax=Pusillimonas sp. TaxID=3040095 RepID=UPI002CA621CB|nr:biotin-independent malonate decarboxylase subunit gamma [Pusillimonas sp.]HUH89015.1 biotin-independent malonate decarboxylase subunit gamma [Pusillimonas sp.]
MRSWLAGATGVGRTRSAPAEPGLAGPFTQGPVGTMPTLENHASANSTPGGDDEAASSRGVAWLSALTQHVQTQPGFPATVRVVDAALGDEQARYIAVVPDPSNRFPRVRNGEVGLAEGWYLARAIRQCVEQDAGSAATDRAGVAGTVLPDESSGHHTRRRPIVAVIDVPSQAYGKLEEGLGIHQALAAVVDAAAQARLAGHPFIGLIVGQAISGAFLALGCQANRLIALRDPGVQVHAMGKASAARITQRTVEQLDALAAGVPPMAYDIESYASLGMLWKSLQAQNARRPTAQDLAAVRALLCEAVSSIRSDPLRDLSSRLGAPNRNASLKVRERMRELWNQDESVPSARS